MERSYIVQVGWPRYTDWSSEYSLCHVSLHQRTCRSRQWVSKSTQPAPDATCSLAGSWYTQVAALDVDSCFCKRCKSCSTSLKRVGGGDCEVVVVNLQQLLLLLPLLEVVHQVLLLVQLQELPGHPLATLAIAGAAGANRGGDADAVAC
eukprot:1156546-Pelagomonas_calceolata.AAC.10